MCHKVASVFHKDDGSDCKENLFFPVNMKKIKNGIKLDEQFKVTDQMSDWQIHYKPCFLL